MPQPQPWPTTPGERPPLSRESTTAWSPRVTSTLERPSGPRTGGGGDGPQRPAGPVHPGWVAAVVVLVVLLLLALGALVWPRGGDEASPSTTSAPRTTTTRSAQRTPSTTRPQTVTPSRVRPLGPAPSQAEVQAMVDELVPFVEQARGLAFTERPAVAVAENPAFDEQARAAFDRHEGAWAQRALLLHVLGVVDPRLDVAAIVRGNEPVGRMAVYDPDGHRIVVRGQRITPYTREQVVAALTMALDDQHFGTERPAYDQSPDEVTWVYDALKAGDATRISDAWLNTLPAPERATRDRAEQDAYVGADPSKLPPAIGELNAFPTQAGTALAAALAGGGNGPLDGAFAEPPRATTYVLHPERLGAVPVVNVPAPAVDGRILRTGVFGELMTIATLADTLASGGAARAAAGWAGDSFVLYEGPGARPCVRIAYRATSPQGLAELHQAYTSWGSRHDGAEVRLDGETLLVSRCVSGGSGRSPA